MFYYLLKYVVLGPPLRLFFRPVIEGAEHIPADGAATVTGNHLSFSDHFLMPAIIRRRITFLAKAEYFTGPGVRGRLTAAFFRSAGQIPVDRSGMEAGKAAIRAATDEIMYAILGLSGQEYVDEYAAKAKAAEHAERPRKFPKLRR